MILVNDSHCTIIIAGTKVFTFTQDQCFFCELSYLAELTWIQFTTVSFSRLVLSRMMEMQRSTLSSLPPRPLCEVRDCYSTLECYLCNFQLYSGSEFNIVMNFTTVHGTGTGEYDVLIKTVDGIPLGQSYLTEPQQPGTYIIKWDVTAKPDPNCDPTQQPCETWKPGNYSASVGMPL